MPLVPERSNLSLKYGSLISGLSQWLLGSPEGSRASMDDSPDSSTVVTSTVGAAEADDPKMPQEPISPLKSWSVQTAALPARVYAGAPVSTCYGLCREAVTVATSSNSQV